MKSKILTALGAGVILSASFLTGTANAGLIDRGNGLIYDDVLDVTWLQDANYAQTSGYDADGKMTWDNAVAWADSLMYGGFDDWRLPSTGFSLGPNGDKTDYYYNCSSAEIVDMDGSGCDYGWNSTGTVHELAYMFYINLSNVGYYDEEGNTDQAGWDTLNTSFTDANTRELVNFDNLFRNLYRSGTEYAPNTSKAWFFSMFNGYQSSSNKSSEFYVWAVRDGDVAQGQDVVEAPEPASVVIFGLALLGLASRKRSFSC